jgi:CTP:molybdopterin cytidylyltransferase MocA
MGRQKLLEPIDGRPMVRRAVDAAARWPTVVIASATVAELLHDARVRVVRNDDPDRGMSHSLRLADAAIPAGEPIAVVLGDLPDCDARAIARVIDAYDAGADVVVPRAGTRLGHPVVFGPAARARIAALPDGDALHTLRDDPALRRRIVEVADAAAFEDIDTEEELAARIGRVGKGPAVG